MASVLPPPPVLRTPSQRAAAAQRAMSPFMRVNPATGLSGQIMATNAAARAGRQRIPRYTGPPPGSMAAAYANRTPNQGISPRIVRGLAALANQPGRIV